MASDPDDSDEEMVDGADGKAYDDNALRRFSFRNASYKTLTPTIFWKITVIWVTMTSSCTQAHLWILGISQKPRGTGALYHPQAPVKYQLLVFLYMSSMLLDPKGNIIFT